MHKVQYLGTGVWRDNNGDMWARHHANPNILSTRQYETQYTEEQFLQSRPDIAFMVKYGDANIITASMEDSAPAVNSTPSEPVIETPTEEPAIETPVGEAKPVKTTEKAKVTTVSVGGKPKISIGK